MGVVTSITAQPADDRDGWVVRVALTVPVDDDELWLPLTPFYEALQKHLPELSTILSDEQAKKRAQMRMWPQDPLDVYDDILNVSTMGHLLESASERDEPLVIVSYPGYRHIPPAGTKRDEISLQIVRRHECNWAVSDPWRAMTCEDQILLSLTAGVPCDWDEDEQPTECGFGLTIIVTMCNSQSERVAKEIVTYLRQAYKV